MSGNEAFAAVSERGWRRGLGNMLESEFARWWKTKMWWIQVLIWAGMIGYFLLAVSFNAGGYNLTVSVMLYSIFGGLLPGIGVIIIMQDVLVGEKMEGTAAWVLSKPVTRLAFILSKLTANSLGVLVTIVFLPGLAAFTLLSIFSKALLNPLNFLAALGVIFLAQLFFLTFTLMLGALFNHRGPVIGLGLALLFLQQYLVGWLPFLKYVLPYTLVVAMNSPNDAVAPALILGMPVDSYLPLLFIALECVLFVGICLWKFNREEF